MGGNSAKQEIQRLKQKIKALYTRRDILETAIEIVEIDGRKIRIHARLIPL